MRLEFLNSDYTDEFLSFLCDRMRIWFYSVVDYRRTELFENYFNLLYPKEKNITIKLICEFAFEHFFITRYQNRIILGFDDIIKIPNYEVYLVDVLKMINYGVVGVEPYPIFTKMFDEFANNIESYLILYNWR